MQSVSSGTNASARPLSLSASIDWPLRGRLLDPALALDAPAAPVRIWRRALLRRRDPASEPELRQRASTLLLVPFSVYAGFSSRRWTAGLSHHSRPFDRSRSVQT